MKYAEIKVYARKMRNNPTAAEAELWKYIRGRRLQERKFLRQHPLLYQNNDGEYFYFIPDFYCAKEKLIIELDGEIHDNQIEKDKNREAILKHLGFRIIRFKNEEVLHNWPQVAKRLEALIQGL